MEQVSREQLRRKMPRIEIQRRMGERHRHRVTYRARQRDLDRPVVLRVFRTGTAGDAKAATRFVREARALASATHEGLASVYDFGRIGDVYYLVTELVDGATLRECIDRGTLRPAAALEMARRICGAVDHAAERGVTHRRVVPESVLLDDAGRPKIVDLGMADGICGRERASDPRADVFGIGMLLHEALTGEPPLGKHAPPSATPGVDGAVDEILGRALDHDPERRYADASELGRAIATLLESPARAARTKKPKPDAKPAPSPSGATGAGARPSSPSEAAEGERASLPAIPFHVSGEVTTATGILALDGDEIRLDYRKRCLGIVPIAFETTRIPLSDIRSVAFEPRRLGPRIRLVPRSFLRFQGLPCGDYELRLRVRLCDVRSAERIAEEIGRRIGSDSCTDDSAS